MADADKRMNPLWAYILEAIRWIPGSVGLSVRKSGIEYRIACGCESVVGLPVADVSVACRFYFFALYLSCLCSLSVT